MVTVMTTCGMYNGAGKFTKDWGVPSKSGVSGDLMTVIPGVGAFASFSPRLNPEGNTIRGIGIIEKMSQIYSNMNLFHKDVHKKDCTRKPYQDFIQSIVAACQAASIGDLAEIQRLYAQGVSLGHGDYDRRTPLHLAAKMGHREVVKFLVETRAAWINAKDRWGATPLDGAMDPRIQQYLLLNGAEPGVKNQQATVSYRPSTTITFSEEQYRLFYAALNN